MNSTLVRLFTTPSEIDGLICKVLAPNDDSGRHGVVIPVDAYPLFPVYVNYGAALQSNHTAEVSIRWPHTGSQDFQSARWKHYQRYPERRLTRLDRSINSVAENSLLVVGRLKGPQENYEAFVIQPQDGVYADLVRETGIRAGQSRCHIDLDWSPDSDPRPSEFIDEFMEIFDADVRGRWLTTSGAGDRAVGETFEAAFSVPRNNNPGPDWRDLEFKSSLEHREASNRDKGLFLKEPTWVDGAQGLNERISKYGYSDGLGRPACFQGVRVAPNIHGLSLRPMYEARRLELLHNDTVVAHWAIDVLEDKLRGKLKNTIFARAKSRGAGNSQEFWYTGVRYCSGPSGRVFMDCIANGTAWLEIRMGPKSSVDNKNKNFGCQFRVSDSTLGDIFSRIEVLKEASFE